MGSPASVGRWTLGQELGRGATSIVVAAHGPGHDDVALKLLLPGLCDDPVMRRRFLRGAAVQASLQHVGVVAVIEHGDDPQAGPFVVTPRLHGGTLRDRLATGVAPRVLLDLLEPVAAALDAAHARGIVHRDVKPSNVLLDGDRGRLTDFGLARRQDDVDATIAGGVIGTLAYVAPEVVRGDRASAAADRYALAVLLVEGLTGTPTFSRTTDAALLFAHVEAPPPSLHERRPELGDAIDLVMATALAKDPTVRTLGALRLLQDVREALGPRGLALGPARPAVRTAPTVDDETLTRGLDPGTPAAQGASDVAGPLGAPPDARPPRFGRRSTGKIGVGAGVVTTVVAAAVVAVLVPGGGDEPAAGDGRLPPTVPDDRTVLGSALEDRGLRAAACAGPGADAACSVVPIRAPGRTLRVPTDGAVRAWAVLGARGELTLQVLRRRSGEIFQVARSQTVEVPDDRVHRFDAALQVDAGDELGLALAPGSRISVRPVPGARAERYVRPVGGEVPVAEGGDSVLAGEVALRVEFEAGGALAPPRQVVGSDAARLPEGRTVAIDDTRLPDGRRVRVLLRVVGREVVVDLERGGRRRSRIVVPGCDPRGRVVEFKAFESDGDPSQLNVGWQNPRERRPIERYFGLDAEMLDFYS